MYNKSAFLSDPDRFYSTGAITDFIYFADNPKLISNVHIFLLDREK